MRRNHLFGDALGVTDPPHSSRTALRVKLWSGRRRPAAFPADPAKGFR
jgi:hypothetical protein